MTLKHAIGSLKIYGLKGCLDFLRRTVNRRAETAFWEKYLISDKSYKPTKGITIVGDLAGAGSLSKVLRDFCINLKCAGVPFQAYNTGSRISIPESEYSGLLTPENEFKLNRYSAIVEMASLPVLPKTNCRRFSIYYWEFESGLLHAYPELADPCNVVVNSDFDLFAFRKQLPPSTHVYKILYPFQFSAKKVESRECIRARYGIGPTDYVVFCNFDYCTGYHRKNPEGAVIAFADAFRNNPSAKLVFKTKSSATRQECVEKLKTAIRSASVENQVLFIDAIIPQADLVGLTNACDAYLSLHRGEGFGLGIAEAMIMGKPVVVTDYSAPKEFCNRENAILIPCRMTVPKECERDIWQYKRVERWAEPDLNAASSALKKLYEQPDFAKQLGLKAKEHMTQYFSTENFKASIDHFLDS